MTYMIVESVIGMGCDRTGNVKQCTEYQWWHRDSCYIIETPAIALRQAVILYQIVTSYKYIHGFGIQFKCTCIGTWNNTQDISFKDIFSSNIWIQNCACQAADTNISNIVPPSFGDKEEATDLCRRLQQKFGLKPINLVSNLSVLVLVKKLHLSYTQVWND